MEFYGDDKEGFVVRTEGKRVMVTARGFWGPSLANQLVKAVVPKLGHEGPMSLEFDLTDLRPLREEGQLAFGALFREAVSRRDMKIYLRAASAITKLQMMRIARAQRMAHLVVMD